MKEVAAAIGNVRRPSGDTRRSASRRIQDRGVPPALLAGWRMARLPWMALTGANRWPCSAGLGWSSRSQTADDWQRGADRRCSRGREEARAGDIGGDARRGLADSWSTAGLGLRSSGDGHCHWAVWEMERELGFERGQGQLGNRCL